MGDVTFKPGAWWPTPVLGIRHENSDDFNARLAQIIYEKEVQITTRGKPQLVAGQSKGLTAHWLEYNVLKWEHKECAELARIVLEGFREFLKQVGDPDDPGYKITGISCWANILRPRESLLVHHHDPAFASAHYTVQTEQDVATPEAESGNTIYFRPGFMDRSHGGKANGQVSPWDDDWRVSVVPKPGNMFFFPSYVRHEVRPNLGKRDRISIALDIFVKKQESLMYFGGPRWYIPK